MKNFRKTINESFDQARRELSSMPLTPMMIVEKLISISSWDEDRKNQALNDLRGGHISLVRTVDEDGTVSITFNNLVIPIEQLDDDPLGKLYHLFLEDEQYLEYLNDSLNNQFRRSSPLEMKTYILRIMLEGADEINNVEYKSAVLKYDSEKRTLSFHWDNQIKSFQVKNEYSQFFEENLKIFEAKEDALLVPYAGPAIPPLYEINNAWKSADSNVLVINEREYNFGSETERNAVFQKFADLLGNNSSALLSFSDSMNHFIKDVKRILQHNSNKEVKSSVFKTITEKNAYWKALLRNDSCIERFVELLMALKEKNDEEFVVNRALIQDVLKQIDGEELLSGVMKNLQSKVVAELRATDTVLAEFIEKHNIIASLASYEKFAAFKDSIKWSCRVSEEFTAAQQKYKSARKNLKKQAQVFSHLAKRGLSTEGSKAEAMIKRDYVKYTLSLLVGLMTAAVAYLGCLEIYIQHSIEIAGVASVLPQGTAFLAGGPESFIALHNEILANYYAWIAIAITAAVVVGVIFGVATKKFALPEESFKTILNQLESSGYAKEFDYSSQRFVELVSRLDENQLKDFLKDIKDIKDFLNYLAKEGELYIGAEHITN